MYAARLCAVASTMAGGALLLVGHPWGGVLLFAGGMGVLFTQAVPKRRRHRRSSWGGDTDDRWSDDADDGGDADGGSDGGGDGGGD